MSPSPHEKICAIYRQLDGLRNNPKDSAQLEEHFREILSIASHLSDRPLWENLTGTTRQCGQVYREDPSNAHFRAWVYHLKRDLEGGGYV